MALEVKVVKGSALDKKLPDIFYRVHPRTGHQTKCRKVVVDKLDEDEQETADNA
jgi:hypothetical protein